MALIELGQKPGGIRELREVIKRFPGSDEDRLARAKLKELGVPISATASR
jgi:TolA-binding protein